MDLRLVLTAYASPDVVSSSKKFKVSGKLRDCWTSVVDGSIILQHSVDKKRWSDINEAVSAYDGGYCFSVNKPEEGIQYYRTTYGGNNYYFGTKSSPIAVNVTLFDLL